MERTELLKRLRKICEEIAEEKGFNKYGEYKSDCGLWDCKEWTGTDVTMTEILEKEHGKLVEYKFYNGDQSDDYVGVRFRFSNPCLHIAFRKEDNFKCMASLEFHDGVYEDGEYTHNGNYSLHECISWEPEGIDLFDMLRKKCREKGIPVD